MCSNNEVTFGVFEGCSIHKGVCEYADKGEMGYVYKRMVNG